MTETEVYTKMMNAKTEAEYKFWYEKYNKFLVERSQRIMQNQIDQMTPEECEEFNRQNY